MPNPKWRFVSHMSATDEHAILYRDDALHVQKEVYTKYRNGHPAKKSSVYYFIDGDDGEYSSESELLRALSGEDMYA